MVVIKHGSIKEEYVATEWLKKVRPLRHQKGMGLRWRYGLVCQRVNDLRNIEL